MKRLFALTIWLTFMLSHFATSQTVYNYNIQWQGKETVQTIGGDSTMLFNRTYSLFRGKIFVWSDAMLDSVRMTYNIGSGFKKAMSMQWDKGYAVGYNKGQEDVNSIYEYMFWGLIAVDITYAILVNMRSEREP